MIKLGERTDVLNITEDFPVHWISKEARAKIVELMLSTRSIIELSRDLGISPTAVRKYVKRLTHPSDEVLYRALKSLAPYEVDTAINIIIDDMLEALRRLYNSVDNKYKQIIRNKVYDIIK